MLQNPLAVFFAEIDPDIRTKFLESHQQLFDGEQQWTPTQGNGVWIDTNRVATVNHVARPNITIPKNSAATDSSSLFSLDQAPDQSTTEEKHHDKSKKKSAESLRNVQIWNFIHQDQTRKLQFVLCLTQEGTVQIIRSIDVSGPDPDQGLLSDPVVILTLEREPGLAKFLAPTKMFDEPKNGSYLIDSMWLENNHDGHHFQAFEIEQKAHIETIHSHTKDHFRLCRKEAGYNFIFCGFTPKHGQSGSGVWCGNQLVGLMSSIINLPLPEGALSSDTADAYQKAGASSDETRITLRGALVKPVWPDCWLP